MISKNGEDTMVALDPLYQMNMGQRTGLSFEDIKVINSAYCQGWLFSIATVLLNDDYKLHTSLLNIEFPPK